MRTFWSFVWAFFLSLMVSQIVAQQMAVYFKAQEEFIAVIMLLIIFTVVSLAIFAIVFVVGKSPAALDKTAFILAGIAIASVAAIALFDFATNGWKQLDIKELQLCAEIMTPAVIVVAAQWWVVRRRALRRSRDEVPA